jgi:hypothetical protein
LFSNLFPLHQKSSGERQPAKSLLNCISGRIKVLSSVAPIF